MRLHDSPLPHIAYFDVDPTHLKSFSLMVGQEFVVNAFQNPKVYPEAISDHFSAVLIDMTRMNSPVFDHHRMVQNHSMYNGCPILSVTVQENVEKKVKSLGHGFDYLSQCMGCEEVVARLRNNVRVFHQHRKAYKLGSLQIELENFRARLRGKDLTVTMLEFQILWKVLSAYPQVCERELLQDQLIISTPSLNTHLSNLRMKLDSWEFEITTLRNKGFVITKKRAPQRAPLVS